MGRSSRKAAKVAEEAGQQAFSTAAEMEVAMKVLIVGSGGREHAIALKLKQSPKVTELYCCPLQCRDQSDCHPGTGKGHRY